MTAQHGHDDHAGPSSDPNGTRAEALTLDEARQLTDAVNKSMELVGSLAQTVTELANINKTLHRRIARLERHLDLPPTSETPTTETSTLNPSTLDLSTLDSPGWEHRLT